MSHPIARVRIVVALFVCVFTSSRAHAAALTPGNIIVSAGGEGYVKPYDGGGVAYQSTLTVLMRPAAARAGAADAPAPGNVVF